MEIVNFNYKDQDYKEELMTHLRGQVFHLTSEKTFRDINKSGCIYNSKDNKCQPIWNSENTFARIHGYICLFDLRDKTDDIIDATLSKYYFLGPSCFEEYDKPYFKLNLAYLILSPSHYDKLIPNEAASNYNIETGRATQYIPKTECWFAYKLPIDYLIKSLLVQVWTTAKQENLADQIKILDYEDRKK